MTLNEQIYDNLKDNIRSFPEEEQEIVKKILARVAKTMALEISEGESEKVKELKSQIPAQLANLSVRAKREVARAVSDTAQQWAVRFVKSVLIAAV